MKKPLLFAMSLLTLVPMSAFARLSSGQSVSYYLSSCGGTLEAKISPQGSGEQLNLIFRDVKECSRIEINGQSLPPLEGTNAGRTGSRTVQMDSVYNGSNTISVHSESGKHRDDLDLDIFKMPDCTEQARAEAVKAARRDLGNVSYASAQFNRVSGNGNLVYDAVASGSYGYGEVQYQVVLDTSCYPLNTQRK